MICAEEMAGAAVLVTQHPANWYPDPTERFQLRYWDGTAWTSHVATDGRQSLSPLVPSPTAVPAASGRAQTQEPSAENAIAKADSAPPDRRVLIEAAVKEWTGQLISLGGRNTLLHFRHLKAGTLDLAMADPSAVTGLLDGKTVALTSLFPEPSDREQAARRCRTIRSKANENLEERGLRTLSLGLGLAAWDNTRGTAQPAAPVLLRSLVLTPRGGAEEEFDLALVDEWEINPTLLHLLKTDYQVDPGADDLEAIAVDNQGRLQQHALFEALTQRCGSVPDWTIDAASAVVANYSYVKMPMVEDLEGSIDALVEHPLVCALAGSAEDRAKVRDGDADFWTEIDAGYPDRQPPRDEFLVLDADASQCEVVNLAVRGANLVVQGPPGTGKSQTIANLIATLVAREKSVLFVAEKRAAIDAVLDRLREVELADLVLDLHEGTGNRRRLASDLGLSLQAIGSIPEPDDEQLHQELAALRDRLREHDAAMNDARNRGVSRSSSFKASSWRWNAPSNPICDSTAPCCTALIERRWSALRRHSRSGSRSVVPISLPVFDRGREPSARSRPAHKSQDLRATVRSVRHSTLPTVTTRLGAAIDAAGFRPADHRRRVVPHARPRSRPSPRRSMASTTPCSPHHCPSSWPRSNPPRRGSLTRFRARLFSSAIDQPASRRARWITRAARRPSCVTASSAHETNALPVDCLAAAARPPRRVAVRLDAAAATSQARAQLASIGEWISADLTPSTPTSKASTAGSRRSNTMTRP